MPYIGRDLNRGNYLKLDDISSSFNSSTKTFNLRVGGSAFTPGSAFSILVSVGGVIQEPESAYQVNNSEITFANAPTAQDSFFCLALGVPIGIGVPGNGTVNGTQMAKPFNYDGYFHLDDANNRVGINSSSPTVALDVIGNIKLNGNLVTGSGAGGLQGNVYAASGISTFNDVRVTNNLTVEGTTTTLDTNLIGVDRVEVGANSNSIVGMAVTQSGTADILNLYDGSTEVFSVADGGNVSITGVTTIAHTGANQLTIKDSDTSGNGSSMRISFKDSGNTERFYIGNDESSNSYLYLGSPSGQNNNVALTVGGSTKLTAFSGGVGINGNLELQDTIYHAGDTDTKIRFPATDVFTAETGGSERLRCDSDGVKVHNGRFYSAGTFGYIESSSTSTATLTLKKSASGADSIDYLQLRDNSNAVKFKISGDGILFTSDVLASHEGDTNTKIRFPADDTISFETGGGERLKIASDGNFVMNGASPNHDASSGSIFIKAPSGNPNRGIKWSDTSDTHYVKLEPSVIDGLTINGYSGVAFATGSRTNSTWAEKVRIDINGNVRINTTRTTATKLHVVGGTASGTAYDAAVFAGGQNSTSGSGVKLYLSGCENDPISRGVILESIMTDNANAHRFSVKVGGSSAAPTERFQLASGGQAYFFGNQTTTPNGIFGFRYDKTGTTDLSVENLSNSSVNNHARLRLASNHSNISLSYYNNGGFYINNASSAGYLHYYEGSDSRLYIDTSGNISINNAATPPSSNGQLGKRLGIKSTQNNVIIGETTNSGNSGLVLESRVTGRSGNARCSQMDLGNGIIKFYTAASAADVTQRMQINGNGQVSISNDGTTDGLLTIKGDSDQVGTPSIRLLDGSDTREVSISNVSGDFVASVHGNDNAIHGHIKLFEGGQIDLNNGGAAGSNANRLRIDVYGTTQVNSIRQRVFAPNTGSTNGRYWKIGSVTLNGSEGFILTFCGTGGYSAGQQIAGTTKVVARCSNGSTLVGYKTGSSIGAQLGIEDVRWKHEGSNVFSIWAKVQHYAQITPFVDFFGGALGGWIPDSTNTNSTSAPSGSTAFSDWEYKQINGVNTIQYTANDTYFLENVRMANGKGIDFSPTTDGGSGTPSELLDDYEEGYFAPEVTNLSSGYASGTFYNRQARYTKVGNMVTCWVHLQWWANAVTSGNDNLEFTITGFPFEVDGVGYSGSCGGGLQAQSWRYAGSGFNNYAVDSHNVQPRINSNEQIRFGVFKHNSITGQVTQKSINGYSPNIEFVFTVRVTTYK